MSKDRELTDKQKKFLEVFFDEAEGDVTKALTLAGYANGRVNTYWIVRSLKDELAEAATIYLAKNGMKAARRMVEVMDDPTAMGNNMKLNAAMQILDRFGVVKKDKMEVHAGPNTGIFILPAKDAPAVVEDLSKDT